MKSLLWQSKVGQGTLVFAFFVEIFTGHLKKIFQFPFLHNKWSEFFGGWML